MKRLAIGIALGLVAAPLTGCDKEETKAAAGEKGKDGEKKGKDGEEKGKDAAPKAMTAADAVKFIPEGATMVMGLDAAKVASSAVFKDNKELMQQGDAGEVMAAAEACKVGMDTWKFMLVGGDTEKDDAMVIVASATGLGTKATLECIAKKSNEKDPPEEQLKITEADGMVIAKSEDGKSTGYGVSDDLFVMAGKDYAESVKALIKGEGKSAADGSLKDILAATDRSAHVYFGAVATADMKQGPAADMKHVTGAVDLSSGLDLKVAADFGADDKAKEIAAEGQKQFDGIKGMAPAMGVPKPVVDSVKIAAKGSVVEVTAKATNEELQAISKTLQAQMK